MNIEQVRLSGDFSPGGMINGFVILKIREKAKDVVGGVRLSLIGNWNSNSELATLYEGELGEHPRDISVPINFKAPYQSGKYELLFKYTPIEEAFLVRVDPQTGRSAVIGKAPRIEFEVSEQTRGSGNNNSNGLKIDSQGPTEAARKFLEDLYSQRFDEMLEVVSDDVYVYQWGKGSYHLPYGRNALKEHVSSMSFDTPTIILNISEIQRFERGTIALIEAVTKKQEGNENTVKLWFKKIDDRWFLFTPPLSLAGYKDSDVDAALKAFSSTWAKRGDTQFTNCKVKKAVPNTFAYDKSLWMEIEYDYRFAQDPPKSAKYGTRISAVWMRIENNLWVYSNMYQE
jgi:hypothetical protein